MKQYLTTGLFCSLFFISLFGLQYSEQGGTNGEKQSYSSLLPNFPFAVYHHGEDVIPDLPVKANVKDVGAVGDGLSNGYRSISKSLAVGIKCRGI